MKSRRKAQRKGRGGVGGVTQSAAETGNKTQGRDKWNNNHTLN